MGAAPPVLLSRIGWIRNRLDLAAQIDVRQSVSDLAADARINVLDTIAALESARVTGARRILGRILAGF